MKISNEDEGSGATPGERCPECGTGLSASQRYCLECGARRGPLPAMVARRIDALKKRVRPKAAETASASLAAAAAAGEGEKDAQRAGQWDFMPSPQVAAVAVLALLAAGVVLGSVTSPLAQSAGIAPILLDLGDSGASESPPEATTASAPSFAPETSAIASTAAAPAALPPEVPAPEPEAPPAPQPLPELPEEEGLPEIKHVFLIVLNGHGYEEAFGKESSAPYLAETLASEGKLLSNYYAVTQGSLANEIALVSGQGPTPQTATNCPEYTAIAPGTESPEGQVEGEGCVYPAETKTLPAQLIEKGLSWKAYTEPDPVPAWRKPFDYFAGLGENPESTQHEGDLSQLAVDLRKSEDAPAFSYIVPNACHDGSEISCAPEQPAGLAGAEGFLKTVVPEITASPAFEEEGGLIAITFDQAPQVGDKIDSSSCCATPEYPNLPAPPADSEPLVPGPVKPTGGGGKVGMLLLSPYVAPGTVDETSYFNHFSLLLSIEELFGLEPLGYAADPALTPFDSSVFDGSPEESTVVPVKPRIAPPFPMASSR